MLPLKFSWSKVSWACAHSLLTAAIFWPQRGLLEQCDRIWLAVETNGSWKHLFLARFFSAARGEKDFAGGRGWGKDDVRERRCSHNLQSSLPAWWSADNCSIFPIVNRELKQQTLWRSRTPTGSSSHSPQCEYTVHVFTSVKIECEILVLEISLLGKNYLVIRILWLNCWPKTKDNSYAIHSAFYNHVNSL